MTGDCRRWLERRLCSSEGEKVCPHSLPSGRFSQAEADTIPPPIYTNSEEGSRMRSAAGSYLSVLLPPVIVEEQLVFSVQSN